jgi:hypothetical protein
MWDGKLVRESTHQSKPKVARDIESAHRARLANGEVGIRERKRMPTLAEFLKDEFLPFVKSHFGDKKPKSREYFG